MNFDLMAIWGHMGFLNRAITITLMLMGLAFVIVAVERLFVMARMKGKSAKFTEEVTPLLQSLKLDDALKLAEEHKKGSHIAALTAALLTGFNDKRPGGKLQPIERAHRELGRFKERFSAQIRRGMVIVATVGSITPFVGLLGTVIGIIVAFQAIGSAGSAGLATVTIGIAEALIETALGLLVAIPAVIVFNLLNGRIALFEEDLNQTSSRLIDVLEDFGHAYHGR